MSRYVFIDIYFLSSCSYRNDGNGSRKHDGYMQIRILHSFIHACLATSCKCVYTALVPFPAHSENGTSLKLVKCCPSCSLEVILLTDLISIKPFLLTLSLVCYVVQHFVLYFHLISCVVIIAITLHYTCLHSFHNHLYEK